jgi:hypothetical protein
MKTRLHLILGVLALLCIAPSLHGAAVPAAATCADATVQASLATLSDPANQISPNLAPRLLPQPQPLTCEGTCNTALTACNKGCNGNQDCLNNCVDAWEACLCNNCHTCR